MNAGQVDAARNLAQDARIALVGFDSARSDAQRPNQRARHDPDFVRELLRLASHVERFCASLHNHPALGPRGKILAQPSRTASTLLGDPPVLGADTNLRFPSTQIDRNMLHGWPPSLAPSSAFPLRPHSG